MADVFPPATTQRGGRAGATSIRTEPNQETTNPGPDLGQRSPSRTGCGPKGSRSFDPKESVSATRCEGSHLEQKIKDSLAGREAILPEHSDRLAHYRRKTVKPYQWRWTGRTARQSQLYVASPVAPWRHI